jgi:ribonuclease P protein component
MNSHTRPGQLQSKVQSLGQSLTGSRLRRHADYLRAYAAARKRQSASMSWFLAPQTPQTLEAQSSDSPATLDLCPVARVGLTVGKVLGRATERNRIKRRMREALRRHVDLLPPGCDLILHPRRVVLTMDFAQLEAEVVRILEQARTEAARGLKSPAAALKTSGPLASGTPAP